jgi:hypothetical protein
MVAITKGEPLEGIRKELGLQSQEGVPNQLHKVVQPTYELRRNTSNIHAQADTTGSGTVTLYTVPTGFDFFITCMGITYSSDAACDCIGSDLIETGGLARVLVLLPMQTLTAKNLQLVIPLPFPLRVNSGTVLHFRGSKTAGTHTRTCWATGYLIQADG